MKTTIVIDHETKLVSCSTGETGSVVEFSLASFSLEKGVKDDVSEYGIVTRSLDGTISITINGESARS